MTNGNAKDLHKIQHAYDVAKEYKKVYISASHKDDISYNTIIEWNKNLYQILNIYTPNDSKQVHHIKLLISRTIWNSS